MIERPDKPGAFTPEGVVEMLAAVTKHPLCDGQGPFGVSSTVAAYLICAYKFVMSMSDARNKPKMGRPSVDSEEVRSRIVRPVLDALDAWAAAEGMLEPRRPEAIRRALAEHLKAKGYLPSDSAEATADPQDYTNADRYVDADPNEAVMVTGVGPMILHRAVRKRVDWREHHGLNLVSVFRGADKQPSVFDMGDLGRLAEMERFQ